MHALCLAAMQLSNSMWVAAATDGRWPSRVDLRSPPPPGTPLVGHGQQHKHGFNSAGLPTPRATLSNLETPRDTAGRRLTTGAIFMHNNWARDGHWYMYINDKGCCPQTLCCDPHTPWPANGCWKCCAAQTKNNCTWGRHTRILGYRTRDFARWENLGVVVGGGPPARNPVSQYWHLG